MFRNIMPRYEILSADAVGVLERGWRRMSPVTIPATLAQQLAEAFTGIALAQLIRPGCPVIFGSFLSNIDIQSGSPSFGTPESAIGARSDPSYEVDPSPEYRWAGRHRSADIYLPVGLMPSQGEAQRAVRSPG